jgi:predicted lactoylglutathione lyase
MELDFMYGRSFQDPDEHQWEIVWKDMSVFDQSPAESGAAA